MVASLHITTLPSTSINHNRTSSHHNMTAFLCKSKASILELMKSMPDVHVAEEEDFVV
jgi:hypothetical protein